MVSLDSKGNVLETLTDGDLTETFSPGKDDHVTFSSTVSSIQGRDVVPLYKGVLSLPVAPEHGAPDVLTTKGFELLETTTLPILSGVTHNGWDDLPTLKPALPSNVQLSLTCGYITVFGLIFVLVYGQLWMIWYYRHKRLSHQTLFLFLCLIWSGLRTSLFSFYFDNCDTANDLDIPLYWLLYSFPVCLQFSMLCLLLHFFAQVVFKAKAKYEPAQYKRPLRLFLGGSVLGFMAMNLACAISTKQYEFKYRSPPHFILYIRVSLTEAMFLIYGILLSVCIFKMTKMASSRRVLEAKGTTVFKAVVATVLINLLFLSRTVYNLISVTPAMKGMANFGYDWINVSDQADAVPGLSRGLAYVSFGIVLFVWEVLPISIVVLFFRVKRRHFEPVLTDFSTQSQGSRVFFFDNPRRYDSEDDLSSQTGSNSHSDGTLSRSNNGEITRTRTARTTPRGTPVNGTMYGSMSARSASSGILSVHGHSGTAGPATYGVTNGSIQMPPGVVQNLNRKMVV
ncbi:G protein-coupled receptor 137Ba [Aplysia californica]|uniref:G protein-coupled receptor 137Ba n=1 Tax=Aplysia californica TaxID=6500 RepID=A0ABM0ZZG4_APLCA|nr:G protein-coupled receptor 137Ba [Aplysia californica]